MREIRVLLLGLTGIAADIVRQVVSQQKDVEIVASLEDVDDVELFARIENVDLVITAYPSCKSGLSRFNPALATKPGLRVLAIEDDGRTACMYTLLPHTTQLGPLSPKSLLQFIRASIQSQPAENP